MLTIFLNSYLFVYLFLRQDLQNLELKDSTTMAAAEIDPRMLLSPLLQLQDKKSMVSCLTSFQVSVRMLMSAIFLSELKII